MNTEEIRARVFTVLAEKGIGQKDFAEKLGTTDKTVSAWKTGRVDSFASMKWLPKIAEVLGTTVEYLVSGEKKEPAPAPAPDFLIKFNSLTPEGQKEVIAFIEFKRGQESQS
ncbi:helix-turn-helix domain-containing protein [Flavonifractor plautii]|uniref:helix-turn-helix domain-containing protein n=1 Tax=Flavonifractor plautii TaxID=292800 RepID=UPI001397C279|nr:helix-turn-helix transcriptional regulator [Flavonifractor plautii]QIA32263.1 helix-turn-helix transcriptional regulator [Flavonifractor plautii]